MGLFHQSKHAENLSLPDDNAVANSQAVQTNGKEIGGYDDTPVQFLTVRSLLMGVLVSMGGFIFGYDTGMHLGNEMPRNEDIDSPHRTNLRIPSYARLSPALRPAGSLDRFQGYTDRDWLLQI